LRSAPFTVSVEGKALLVLILRSVSQKRVSKDGHNHDAILRDASLRDAPQDEGR
jgi:hypothetical protein